MLLYCFMNTLLNHHMGYKCITSRPHCHVHLRPPGLITAYALHPGLCRAALACVQVCQQLP